MGRRVLDATMRRALLRRGRGMNASCVRVCLMDVRGLLDATQLLVGI